MICTGLGSCVAAGYFDCCRDYVDASNGTMIFPLSNFTCQDPIGGRCFCDFACHTFLDCCEDIDCICPSKYYIPWSSHVIAYQFFKCSFWVAIAKTKFGTKIVSWKYENEPPYHVTAN